MKNGEKFKSYDERERAFSKFCTNCEKCKLNKIRWKKFGAIRACAFAWLDLEAEKPKSSKDMISDLIEEVSNVIIGNEKANRLRIEMMTKLLSHRDKIQQIWQAQDKEEQNQ